MKKGSHHTEAAKEKIRQYRLGKKHTEETKLKQSYAKKGHRRNMIVCTNGHIDIWITSDSMIPFGFWKGSVEWQDQRKQSEQ